MDRRLRAQHVLFIVKERHLSGKPMSLDDIELGSEEIEYDPNKCSLHCLQCLEGIVRGGCKRMDADTTHVVAGNVKE